MSGTATAPQELLQRLGARPLVLFDGMCHVCDGTVNFILKRDRNKKFVFAPLQSELAQKLLPSFGLDPEELSTIVLVENGRATTRSTAILRMARELGFPWSLLRIFGVLPRSWRDLAYASFAKRRYRWFGKRATCALPSPEFKERFLS